MDDRVLEILEGDPLGLLEVKPVQSAMSEDERLTESFFEIVEFVRQNGREPENDLANMQEARLAMRLSGFRSSSEKIKALLDLDEFGLLIPLKKPESIDDVLEGDDLNLLDNNDESSIFNLRHVPQDIEMPDYIANRKPCEAFDQFESLFKQCHADLQSEKRALRPFVNEQQIHAGEYFILSGVMVYIAEVGAKEKKNKKVNARLRCIFENGTEGDLLLRSLARNLYKDGRRVTEHKDRLMDDLNQITDEDGQTGFVYILRSLSTNPEIAEIKNLYKIGFSTQPIEERIKNAEDDPTYLMAKVHVMETFECFNLNPQKLELLLHKFFGKVCLEVDVFDKSGKRFTPREWFVAPLPVIEEAIELIISGEIIHCVYDDELKVICKK